MGATYRSAIGLMEVAIPATPNPKTAAPIRHHFFPCHRKPHTLKNYAYLYINITILYDISIVYDV